jgi:ubiquinone/menaquinone biosynthesis C-methylase UbiE
MTAVTYHTYGGSAPENYERYFVPAIGEPLARDLVARAALRTGERVLDVACGTGIVTRQAAATVGAEGTVAGLDSNPGMLAVARSATYGTAIDWYEAAAEAMPLPDRSFDVVLCQMGVQFFDDRLAGLREMRRVLAAGGRVVLNVPGPTPPPFRIMADSLAAHVAPELAGFVEMVFSLHEADALHELLETAGFDDIVVDRTVQRLRLPPPEAFLWQYVHATPMADALAQAGDQARSALQDDVVARWQPFVDDGALVVEVGMVPGIASAGG